MKAPDGTKKRVKGGPIAANRVLAGIRSLFNWALRRGVVDSVPTTLVERPGEETSRDRALAADEIRTVWQAAEKLTYPTGPYFQMVLLTAQRRDEVSGMRWADIDLNARTWTLPASATKAGRGHIVPLSEPAMEILRIVPRIGKGEFVFTTAGKVPVSGFSVAKRRLDKKVADAREKAGCPIWTIGASMICDGRQRPRWGGWGLLGS